jgi:hypothetical protein
MPLPDWIVSIIYGITSPLPWPWNAPVRVLLATIVWVVLLAILRRFVGWVDFQVADRARLAGEAPGDAQRLIGGLSERAIRWTRPLLWVGVIVTGAWSVLEASASGPGASMPPSADGFIRLWPQIAAPYVDASPHGDIVYSKPE